MSKSPALNLNMFPLFTACDADSAPCMSRLPPVTASNSPTCVTVPQLAVAVGNVTVAVLAVAPPLSALGKPWLTQLKEALDEANARLDALLSAAPAKAAQPR